MTKDELAVIWFYDLCYQIQRLIELMARKRCTCSWYASYLATCSSVGSQRHLESRLAQARIVTKMTAQISLINRFSTQLSAHIKTTVRDWFFASLLSTIEARLIQNSSLNMNDSRFVPTFTDVVHSNTFIVIVILALMPIMQSSCCINARNLTLLWNNS